MAGTTKTYTLYAALHEDIAEGFVWLKHEDLPPRCIVKITYRNNDRGHSVFCEALQLEENFLRRYNQPGCRRCKINDDTAASSMVINHWYRARLGQPSGPLETKKAYRLQVEAYDRWYNSRWGKLRACLHHPQVVVRVAVCLAIVSVVLGTLGTLPELFHFASAIPNHMRPRSKPLRLWNDTTLKAEYQYLAVRQLGSDDLVFVYDVRNTGDIDYEITQNSSIKVAARLGDSYVFDSTEKLQLPIYIPAHSKTRVELIYLHSGFDNPPPRGVVTRDKGDKLNAAAAEYVRTELRNIDGFVVFDDVSRCQIDLPAGWKTPAKP